MTFRHFVAQILLYVRAVVREICAKQMQKIISNQLIKNTLYSMWFIVSANYTLPPFRCHIVPVGGQ